MFSVYVIGLIQAENMYSISKSLFAISCQFQVEFSHSHTMLWAGPRVLQNIGISGCQTQSVTNVELHI